MTVNQTATDWDWADTEPVEPRGTDDDPRVCRSLEEFNALHEVPALALPEPSDYLSDSEQERQLEEMFATDVFDWTDWMNRNGGSEYRR